MRGERRARRKIGQIGAGSSPHARGTPVPDCHEYRVTRIIPACAGNASWKSAGASCSPDHPRMRGERRRVLPEQLVEAGSSPHARGTRPRTPSRCGVPRIIPACAGNALQAPRESRPSADHPRMRGERAIRCIRSRSCGGSSPHARGTPERVQDAPDARRIIPACAGNAWRARHRTRRPADHPRMRGERRQRHGVRDRDVGSSPHARGTRERHEPGPAHWRIIPACAGNAPIPNGRPGALTDHPRMRGERLQCASRSCRHYGSSPHARGTPAGAAQGLRECRIIPACAGNAAGGISVGRHSADHPRMRGERPSAAAIDAAERGSSPHARGTRRTRPWGCTCCRIIPACAGNAPTLMPPARLPSDHPRMRGERPDSASRA